MIALKFVDFRFEMAEECSDDDDDKAVIRKIRKRVLKKMTMFRSIVHVRSQIPVSKLQKDDYVVSLICNISSIISFGL